jgi:phosphatidylserine/phosphatidylglycerophosphate/cardiolipin synthase-like enzyme
MISIRTTLPAALAFLVIGASTGCSSAEQTDDPDVDPDMDMEEPPSPSGDGHVADAVLATLNSLAGDKRGRTWALSSDNLLEGDWLIQSPPEQHWGKGHAEFPIPAACTGDGCDADFGLRSCTTQDDCIDGGLCTEIAATVTAPMQSPSKLCAGHSDFLYDHMYRVMVSAERYVDVASLGPPDGRFESAMRNAVTYLANSGRPVLVRFIFGNYPVIGTVKTKEVLARLTRDAPISSQAQVFVGSYYSHTFPPSWNHSKIVAVDGRTAIVGGHNLWDPHYLTTNPVHDLSMRLEGPAAIDAHAFASEQWDYTCSTMTALTCFAGTVCSHGWQAGAISTDCAPALDVSAFTPDKPGDSRTIAMGRLAYVDSSNMSNEADTAFLAMLGAARTSIKISQQDLGPLKLLTTNWPDALFAQMGVAMVRGVDVYIVLSNLDGLPGGLEGLAASYSNGWTLEEVGTRIRDYIEQNPPPGAPSGVALRDLICQRLHLAPLRFSSEDTWDGIPFPNHAKLVMIDDQAFYIGSQNQYPADLTEYGFMIDDTRAAATVVSSYWNPLWEYSSRRAISGSEAAICSLR